jgi:hypothetical protein
VEERDLVGGGEVSGGERFGRRWGGEMEHHERTLDTDVNVAALVRLLYLSSIFIGFGEGVCKEGRWSASSSRKEGQAGGRGLGLT